MAHKTTFLLLAASLLLSAATLTAQPPHPGPGPHWNRGNEYPQTPREVRPPQPSRNHVWITGDWVRFRGRYEYQPGRWVIPPKRNLTWQSGYWVNERNGRVWQRGYWVQRNGKPYFDNNRRNGDWDDDDRWGSNRDRNRNDDNWNRSQRW